MDDGQETSQASGGGGNQRPGRTRRVSSRVPSVIEGQATDVSPPVETPRAPNPPPEEQVAAETPGISLESADAPLANDVPHVPPPEGPVTDAPMPVEPKGIWTSSVSEEKPDEGASTPGDDWHVTKETFAPPPPKKSYAGLAAAAAIVVALFGGAGWIYGTDDGRNFATSLGIPGVTQVRTAATATPAPPPTVTAARPTPTPASPMGATSAPPPSQSVPAPTAPTAVSQSPLSPSASSSAASPTSAPPPARVETQAPSLAATPAAAPANESRFADLDRKLSALDTRIASIGATPPKAAPETTSALNAQDARLAVLERTLNGLDKRLASIEAQLAPKAETRAAQAPDVASRENDTSAARIVVAQGLLTAVTSGAPYRAPLDALRALGAEDASLTKLSGAATTGVPTVAGLRDSFAVLRPRLRTQAKVDPDASWSDKVRVKLSSLVTVRPASERTGPSAEAVASRMDAALARGDVVAAVSEARTLPASDALVVKDWLDGATRRVDAEAAARALVASSLAALAKPKS